MRIAPSLLRRLDLPTAVQEETSKPSDLLPFASAERALAGRVVECAQLLAGRFQSGVTPALEEVLPAPKSQRGLRPAAVLPMQERCIIRALVNLLQPELPTMARTTTSYDAFTRGP